MGQIEKSRFWLDVEFQYWDVGFDQIIKFTISETGNILLESVENLDPDDSLSNLEVSTLSKYFPKTPNQFLDAIFELEPKIFQIQDLCTVTYKGDSEILERIWEYLEIDIEGRSYIPDEEVEFVRSSRPHLPGKSAKEIREFKDLHGFDFRNVVVVGDQEWGTSFFEEKGFVFALEDIFKMENSHISNPNFTFALQFPAINTKFTFKVMDFGREYSIGYLEYLDTKKWVKIPGTPGHALAIFILDYLISFVDSEFGYQMESLDRVIGLLVDFPFQFGNRISLETSELNLHFKLNQNPIDYGVFLARYQFDSADLDFIDTLKELKHQGQFESGLFGNDLDNQDFEISISKLQSLEGSKLVWHVAYSAGFKSISRDYSTDIHLLDLLLRIFNDMTLQLQIEHLDYWGYSFPAYDHGASIGKSVSLNLVESNF
jgi:hypothetical protein